MSDIFEFPQDQMDPRDLILSKLKAHSWDYIYEKDVDKVIKGQATEAELKELAGRFPALTYELIEDNSKTFSLGDALPYWWYVGQLGLMV